MSVTKDELVALLRAEASFTELATLGPEALPILRALIDGDDAELATKAAALAGQVKGPAQVEALQAAQAHDVATVRMAAVRAAINLSPGDAQPLITQALRDDDPGVRAVATRSLREASPELRKELEAVVDQETDPAVRGLMKEVVSAKP
jgi:HEAT repeat protein